MHTCNPLIELAYPWFMSNSLPANNHKPIHRMMYPTDVDIAPLKIKPDIICYCNYCLHALYYFLFAFQTYAYCIRHTIIRFVEIYTIHQISNEAWQFRTSLLFILIHSLMYVCTKCAWMTLFRWGQASLVITKQSLCVI